MRFEHLLLCGLVAAALASSCLGCNNVIIDDTKCNGAVVSGRTMSFPAALAPHVSAAGPGSTLLLSEIAPGVQSTFGTSIRTRYGFVCMTNIPDGIEKVIPNPNDPFRSVGALTHC